MLTRRKRTDLIKAEAIRLGFNDCGISQSTYLEEDAMHLKSWLDRGFHGEMKYMENYFDKRVDPGKLVPGSKSVISVILSYNTEKDREDASAPVISKYAYNRDYHKVLKKKLRLLLSYIQKSITECEARIFVDSAPVLERAWAAKSGLGWIGKNSNLISPKFGSFVFIGSIITSVELEYDKPIKETCGGCTKCLQNCPTSAIIRPKVIDSNKCISYFTIEYKGQLPETMTEKFRNRVFGCDICQDVCPWNRKAPVHTVPEFEPKQELIKMSHDEWKNLDEETYTRLFEGTAVKRTKYSGLKRNIDFLMH